MGIITLGKFIEQLGEKTLVIPLLQRNYRWSAGNPNNTNNERNTACGLLNDILTEKKDDLLVGIMALYDGKNEKYQLIDGQQRFITLALIAKALGQTLYEKLVFERDTDGAPRREFLLNDVPEDYKKGHVDVDRMYDNYKELKIMLSAKNKAEMRKIYNKMLDKVKLIPRFTTREPLEEYLNLNFAKTPFCAADYVKAYMLMDAENGETESNAEKRKDILKLWARLQNSLYSLQEKNCLISSDKEKSLENDMFKLVNQNYKHFRQNRMELLFEDDYYDEEDKLVQARYFEEGHGIAGEKERLEHFDEVMRELIAELCIKDINNKLRPNFTAYNAFNLLCAKHDNARFFKLFAREEKASVAGILREFSLTAESEQQLRKSCTLDDVNEFVEAIMKPTLSKTLGENPCKIKPADMAVNAQYYGEFRKYFDEYINMLSKCKQADNLPSASVLLLESGKNEGNAEAKEKPADTVIPVFSVRELFKKTTGDIIIPCIQRDYTMGGFAAQDGNNYIVKFLTKIRFMELRAQFINGSLDKSTLEKQLDEKGLMDFVDYDGVTKEKLVEHFFPTDIDDKKEFFCETFKDNLCGAVNSFSKKPLLLDFSKNDENVSFKLKDWVYDEHLQNIGLRNSTDSNQHIFRETVLLSPNNKIDRRNYSKFIDYSKKVCDLGNAVLNWVFNSLNTNVTAQNREETDFSEDAMSFGCVTCCRDSEGKMWIYDGQQRITTVVILLCAALLRNYDDEIARLLLNKDKVRFRFEGRENANEMLNIIFNAATGKGDRKELFEKLRLLICDQTTYSIYVLLEKLCEENPSFAWEQIRKINPAFLLDKLQFQLVKMENMTDSEQLFIELNEGVWLTPTEHYKAKLSVEIGKISSLRTEFMRRADNEWLDSFGNEDAEFKAVQYCIKYAYWELRGYSERGEEDLGGLDTEVIELAMEKLDELCELCKQDSVLPVGTVQTWIKLCMSYPDKTACFNRHICFCFEEFSELAERMEKLGLFADLYTLIREHRENGYVCVPEKEQSTEGVSADKSGQNEDVPDEETGRFSKSALLLLLHRLNRYRAAVYCHDSDWNANESGAPFALAPEEKPLSEAVIFDRWNGSSTDEILAGSDTILNVLYTLSYTEEPVIVMRKVGEKGYIYEEFKNWYAQNQNSSCYYCLGRNTKNSVNISGYLKDPAKLSRELYLCEKVTLDRVKKQHEYVKPWLEFYIRKGLLTLPLKKEMEDAVKELSPEFQNMLWHLQNLRSATPDYNSNSEYCRALNTLLDNCDNSVRKKLSEYACRYATNIADAKTDDFGKDFNRLRYCVQNYLNNNKDFAEELLIECKSVTQGFNFRSLFPAEVYLGSKHVSDEHKNAYREECGFNTDKVIISAYNVLFNL